MKVNQATGNQPVSSSHEAVFKTYCKQGKTQEVENLLQLNPMILIETDPKTSNTFIDNLFKYNREPTARAIFNKMLGIKARWIDHEKKFTFLYQLFKIGFLFEFNPLEIVKLIEISFKKSLVDNLFNYILIKNFFNKTDSPKKGLDKFHHFANCLADIESTQRAFHDACQAGNTEAFEEYLVRFPTLIVSQDPNTGDSPLIVAARHRQWGLFSQIVSYIFDLSTQFAFIRPCIETFKLKNRGNETALTLINQYLNDNSGQESEEVTMAKNMKTLLIAFAVKSMSFEQQMKFFQECSVHVTDPFDMELILFYGSILSKDWTAFKKSCGEGKLDEVKKCIEYKNAYLIEQDSETQKTGLMLACENGQWEVALYLIEQMKAHDYTTYIDSQREKQHHLRAFDIAKKRVSLDKEPNAKRDLVMKLLDQETFLSRLCTELNMQNLPGITKIAKTMKGLVFTYSHTRYLERATEFFNSRNIPVVSVIKKPNQEKDTEESEEKTEIIHQIIELNETVKKFPARFTKYWQTEECPKESRKLAITDDPLAYAITDVSSNYLPKNPLRREERVHKKKALTNDIKQKLQAKKEKEKEKEVETVLSSSDSSDSDKETSEVNLEVQTTTTSSTYKPSNPSPYAGRIDTRVNPIEIINRNAQVTEDLDTPSESMPVLGEDQVKRLATARLKFVDFENFRDRVQSLDFSIRKAALLGALLQVLEALYPTSEEPRCQNLKEESACLNLLNCHFMLPGEGLKLRTIIRSAPFLIEEQDLIELMERFKQSNMLEKMDQLSNKTTLPISLTDCAMFKKYAAWIAPQKEEKKSFYLSEAMNSLKVLKQIKKEIKFEVGKLREDKAYLNKSNYFFFTKMENCHLLCEATKKIFADIQKYLSQLPLELLEKLKKENYYLRKIYEFGTIEAHEVPKVLETGGEAHGITSETVFNYLIRKKRVLKELRTCIKKTQISRN